MKLTFVQLPVAAARSTPAFALAHDTDPDLAKRDADDASGKRAADAKDWPTAVRLYERAEKRNPDHADPRNSLGYAHRNLRQYDLAFKHRERAIEIDPRHRGAHQYVGGTYLMTGDLASAEEHLAALRQICLLACEQLEDLEHAVAEYRSKKR